LYQYQPPKRRPGRKALIWVISVLVLLAALDFGAKAFAESQAATQIQKQGFPKKPSVSIAGFPFLTQVISRKFHQITISSSDIPAGPVKITSLNVVAHNVKLNSSFKSGTAGPLDGTILISLGAIGGFLKDAGPLAEFLGSGPGSGLKIAAVGSNQVRAHLNLGVGLVNAKATWRVTSAGPDAITLHLISSNGLPPQLLDAAKDVKIPLKTLPAGLKLTGKISSSSGGIVAHVFARSLAF
jgi:LmeA-like phospholipid-binding